MPHKMRWVALLVVATTAAAVGLLFWQPWNTDTPGVADNATRLRLCGVTVDEPVDVLNYGVSIMGRGMVGLAGGWGGDKPLADDSVLVLETGIPKTSVSQVVFDPAGQVVAERDPNGKLAALRASVKTNDSRALTWPYSSETTSPIFNPTVGVWTYRQPDAGSGIRASASHGEGFNGLTDDTLTVQSCHSVERREVRVDDRGITVSTTISQVLPEDRKAFDTFWAEATYAKPN